MILPMFDEQTRRMIGFHRLFLPPPGCSLKLHERCRWLRKYLRKLYPQHKGHKTRTSLTLTPQEH